MNNAKNETRIKVLNDHLVTLRERWSKNNVSSTTLLSKLVNKSFEMDYLTVLKSENDDNFVSHNQLVKREIGSECLKIYEELNQLVYFKLETIVVNMKECGNSLQKLGCEFDDNKIIIKSYEKDLEIKKRILSDIFNVLSKGSVFGREISLVYISTWMMEPFLPFDN